jgi:hypothetical protein
MVVELVGMSSITSIISMWEFFPHLGVSQMKPHNTYDSYLTIGLVVTVFGVSCVINDNY